VISDTCVFTRMVDNQYVYLALHVDDFLYIKTKIDYEGNTQKEVQVEVNKRNAIDVTGVTTGVKYIHSGM
jgi:hypothetical protein